MQCDVSNQANKRAIFLHKKIRMDYWSTYFNHWQMKNKKKNEQIEKNDVCNLVNEIVFSRICKRKIKETFKSTSCTNLISVYIQFFSFKNLSFLLQILFIYMWVNHKINGKNLGYYYKKLNLYNVTPRKL